MKNIKCELVGCVPTKYFVTVEAVSFNNTTEMDSECFEYYLPLLRKIRDESPEFDRQVLVDFCSETYEDEDEDEDEDEGYGVFDYPCDRLFVDWGDEDYSRLSCDERFKRVALSITLIKGGKEYLVTI